MLQLVLLWFGLKESKVKLKPTINTTGQKVQIKPKVQSKNHLQKKAKQVPTKAPVTAQTAHDVEPLDLGGMSYLAVYRLYRKAELCERYHSARNRNVDDWQAIDFIDSFWEEKEKQWVRNGQDLMDFLAHPEQNESLHAYVEMCELMAQRWFANEQFSTTHSLPKYAFYELLQVKKTKTKKESRLKKLINLEYQSQEAARALASSIEGEDSWTIDELAAAKARIKALRKTLIRGHDSADEYAKQHNKRVWAQIHVINQQISGQKLKNAENIQFQIVVLEGLLNQAKTELKTQDPDVYLLAMMVSNLDPRFFALFPNFDDELLGRFFWDEKKDQYKSQYEFPMSELMASWRLNQTQKGLYFVTIKASMLFYYCSLGADCGPESPLVYSMCLGFLGMDNKDVCGVGVMDYYLGGQLTAGQIHDVEWMLDVMERQYAP